MIAIVRVAPFTCTPHTLCNALIARAAELRHVRIDHPASLTPWLPPGTAGAFDLHSN